jgi:hypothetical protein
MVDNKVYTRILIAQNKRVKRQSIFLVVFIWIYSSVVEKTNECISSCLYHVERVIGYMRVRVSPFVLIIYLKIVL